MTRSLDVMCPWCLAYPGDECTDQQLLPRERFHQDRTNEAAQQTRLTNKARKVLMTKKTNAPKKLKRPVGRPASAHAERYQIRHDADQMDEWLAAAGVAEPGPVFQHWIRTTLDRAAKKAAP